MSSGRAARLLFVGAFLALPLPMLGLDGSLVPAARFVQLALVMVGLTANEGTGGMVGTLVALFVGHALVYTGAIAVVCWALHRFPLSRLPASGRGVAVVAVTLSLLVVGSFARVYDTQFHHSHAHATLLELYW